MGPNPPCFKAKPHMHVHKGTYILSLYLWALASEGARRKGEQSSGSLGPLREQALTCPQPLGARASGPASGGPAALPGKCHPGWRGLLSLSQNVSHSTFTSQPAAICQTPATTAWTPLSQGFELIQWVFCLRDQHSILCTEKTSDKCLLSWLLEPKEPVIWWQTQKSVYIKTQDCAPKTKKIKLRIKQ